MRSASDGRSCGAVTGSTLKPLLRGGFCHSDIGTSSSVRVRQRPSTPQRLVRRIRRAATSAYDLTRDLDRPVTRRSASSTPASAASPSRGRSSTSCRARTSSTWGTRRARRTAREPIAEVRAYALQCLDHLVDLGVKSLVIACNTASAAMLRDARERYDDPRHRGHPARPPDEPSQRPRPGRVGVICTEATATSALVRRRFRRRTRRSRSRPRPARGSSTSSRRASPAAPSCWPSPRSTSRPSRSRGVDTLILGCTHYPLLTGVISYVIGRRRHAGLERRGVRQVDVLDADAARPAAAACRATATARFLTTGNPEKFTGIGRRLMGDFVADVEPLPELLDDDLGLVGFVPDRVGPWHESTAARPTSSVTSASPATGSTTPKGRCSSSTARPACSCAASVSEGVPRWRKGSGLGWVTAEYSMLPRATHTRSDRESVKGRIGGRTHEISRLVGRSLRGVIDYTALGENTIAARLRRAAGRRRHAYGVDHRRVRRARRRRELAARAQTCSTSEPLQGLGRGGQRRHRRRRARCSTSPTRRTPRPTSTSTSWRPVTGALIEVQGTAEARAVQPPAARPAARPGAAPAAPR